MKSTFWTTTACLVTVAAGAFALSANSQEGKTDKKTTPAGASMDDMTPKPGPEHKVLAGKVGHWTFKMKMNSPAGPMESIGTADIKPAFNGFFIEDTTKSTMMGMPFDGHGYTGYDTIKKKYVGVWLDSMSSGIMHSEGTYDAASKTFTFTMDMPDQMTGTYVKEHIVEKWMDNDHFMATYTKEGSDGKGMSDFTIDYTRAK